MTQSPPPNTADYAAQASEEQVIAVLTALLLTGATVAGVASVIGMLPGMTPAVVGPALKLAGAVGLVSKPIGQPQLGSLSNAAIIKRHGADAIARARAAYLVRATRRMANAAATGDRSEVAKAQTAERRYRANHEAMSRVRLLASRNVITAAGRRRPDAQGRLLLGWYHPTEKPCPDCAPFVGHDFDALNPPSVGYPGAVHPHDFCFPGPPIGVQA